MSTSRSMALGLLAATLFTACAEMPAPRPAPFDQSALPEAVRVPAGHRVALETVGVGQITYACRAKPDAADTFAWMFVGPQAELRNRTGTKVGEYYGPPATWTALDGSSLTGTQLAVAPATPGSIPLQLVKLNPAEGQGAMVGMSHVQRVATQGGVAPTSPCNASSAGREEIVRYQADYIFWKAA